MPLADIDDVKVGQSVSVAVDGIKTSLLGKVESIGMLSSTSGSITTFPVTVKLDEAQSRLYDGTGADVVITTGRATDVVLVPNSAIRSVGTSVHTVTVAANGTTKTVRITLGVVGTVTSEVRSGLHAGDKVVVADLSQDLPSSATSGTTNKTGSRSSAAAPSRGFRPARDDPAARDPTRECPTAVGHSRTTSPLDPAGYLSKRAARRR